MKTVQKPRHATYDSEKNALFYETSGGHLFLSAEDNRSNYLKKKAGITQPRVLRAWMAVISKAEPDVVLDIGANHGEMVFPLRFADDCQIHLYEPNPNLHRALTASIAHHPDGGRMRLHQKALSAAPGRLTFHVDNKWSGMSSLDYRSPDAKFKGRGEQSYTEVDVEVTTIDAELAKLPKARFLAVKIDVEGHETQALAGASKAFSSPFAILAECVDAHLQKAGSSSAEMIGRLREFGSVYAVGSRGLTPLLPGDEIPERFDLVATNRPELIA